MTPTENSAGVPSRGAFRLADLIVLVAVFLVYASVTTTRYAFMDDYLLLAARFRHDGAIVKMNLDMGRPVAAWIMDVSFNAMGAVADLRWLRLAGILGFALAVLLIRRIATRAGWNLFSAACLALLFAMLPSIQVYVGWTTLWFYGYIISLVAGALLLLDATPALPGPKRIAAVGMAAGMLIVAGLAYQPMLFLYLPLFLMRYLATPEMPRRFPFKIAALHVSILGGAMAACYCVFKFGPHPSTRGAPPADWLAKILWFFEQPFIHVLNLLNIDVNNHPWAELVAALALAVIVCGSLCAFGRGRRRWALLVSLLFFPAILMVTYTPNMITVESWPAFRSAYSIYCVGLVAFMWALHQILRTLGRRQQLWPALAGGLTVLACLLAQMQCYTLFALPQAQEFDLMRMLLIQSPLKAGDRVLLVQPENDGSYTWIQLYDEFGIPSSHTTWVPRDMFYVVLREVHPELTRNGLAVTLSLSDEPPVPTDVDVVIDMKAGLQRLRR